MSSHVYRVDRFIVPLSAREEFLGRVKKTHALLKAQSGFLQDIVLEQVSGTGESTFVTMVEWDGQASIENAKAAVASMYRQADFNPQVMFERLGITAEMGSYQRVDS